MADNKIDKTVGVVVNEVRNSETVNESHSARRSMSPGALFGCSLCREGE